MTKPVLKLDWCGHEAAKYAVEKWHYSSTMPKGKNCYIGVWEAQVFVGAVIFGTGAGMVTDGRKYGLLPMQMAELVRVALTKHKSPVSRILAIATRKIKKQSPGLRLLISFADPGQLHHGGIYQASNWIYTGTSSPADAFRTPDGRLLHQRVVRPGKWMGPRTIPEGSVRVRLPGKHRYLYPLDDEIRQRIEPLRMPYPKRAGSADSGTPTVQVGGGGATPTPALSNTQEA